MVVDGSAPGLRFVCHQSTQNISRLSRNLTIYVQLEALATELEASHSGNESWFDFARFGGSFVRISIRIWQKSSTSTVRVQKTQQVQMEAQIAKHCLNNTSELLTSTGSQRAVIRCPVPTAPTFAVISR